MPSPVLPLPHFLVLHPGLVLATLYLSYLLLVVALITKHKYTSLIHVLWMAPFLFLSRIRLVWMTPSHFLTFLDHVCMPVILLSVRPFWSYHMSTLSPWSPHIYPTLDPSLRHVPLPVPTSPVPLFRLFFPFPPPLSLRPFLTLTPTSPFLPLLLPIPLPLPLSLSKWPLHLPMFALFTNLQRKPSFLPSTFQHAAFLFLSN